MKNENIYLTIRGDFPQFERCILHPAAGMELWDALEEVLYVWYELTPCGRYWRQELFGATGEAKCRFTYAGTEFVEVTRTAPYEFTLKDIREN